MLEAIAFYTIGGLMLGAAVVVITSRQPVYSVLSLLAAMFCLAMLFVMLGAYFVAALQILLYAGAVLVLFLFVIMLLNLRSELIPHVTSTLRRAGSIIVGLLLCLQLGGLAIHARIGQSLPDAAPGFGTVEEIGRLLFTTYLLPFELTSFLILAAIVGAITLARSKQTVR